VVTNPGPGGVSSEPFNCVERCPSN
jgi:hypothetical protein